MPELMKGKVWHERKHKVTYPVYAEVKHDEIRCHVIVNRDTYDVLFMSYAGKPLANMQGFSTYFAELAMACNFHEFDCGFEANENFNDSYRWVRSTKGIPDDLIGAPTRFYLFDLPTHGGQYEGRREAMGDVRRAAVNVGIDLYLPTSTLCRSEDHVDLAFLDARKQGYEGLMVKSRDHLYERGKRIDGWLKMKPENDADGIITAVHRGTSIEGEPLDRVTSITIRVEDGSEATPHGITHELGRDMLTHPEKYIGKWAEFKYMERDRQGGYRHPTFNRLREAKS